ncbi:MULTISPECIES: ABC transporter ATP-binding protein [Kosmotoga]|jgi:NitT/TauT family transport system ATP-binding protein|uniref:ABC transporter related n=1 Tax=Kosmotoga olearia (strain ATCC BAA-1733 / DSM 21960 / TBF 19.5.1) TaxID=521045 RepID=C5CEP3_KOSOT|nr:MULTISPECIES: ABC transporter ATP-binding protein [Kosmotoga]ACR80223.1 ABC transporter related [Kosmotoga olearia TBF 19.5.1]MDI3523492.1 NitT/TauT family transport system ATP-binding protein [Kosmotoga sp.]MDK2952965.1 NitT/TauT family transport system ATP-binding protein [Kosmotoga sp.]OAA20163.1 hypothetical protein DU53_08440 [Kosmotoga sp. DU53]
MLIKAEGVSKSFGNNQVIQNLYLSVTEGEFLSVLGSSGCGKTTLLRLLAGILKPDSGRIATNRSRIGFVFQDDRLIPWKNVLYNVSLVSSEERAKKMLKRVELADALYKYPGELSGGMAKRVNLARALSYNPEILFLDEPFSSLDVVTREKMMELIASLWKEVNLTIIMVTHDPLEAAELSTRVVVSSKGFKRLQEFELGDPGGRTFEENARISKKLLDSLRKVSDFVQ